MQFYHTINSSCSISKLSMTAHRNRGVLELRTLTTYVTSSDIVPQNDLQQSQLE